MSAAAVVIPKTPVNYDVLLKASYSLEKARDSKDKDTPVSALALFPAIKDKTFLGKHFEVTFPKNSRGDPDGRLSWKGQSTKYTKKNGEVVENPREVIIITPYYTLDPNHATWTTGNLMALVKDPAKIRGISSEMSDEAVKSLVDSNPSSVLEPVGNFLNTDYSRKHAVNPTSASSLSGLEYSVKYTTFRPNRPGETDEQNACHEMMDLSQAIHRFFSEESLLCKTLNRVNIPTSIKSVLLRQQMSSKPGDVSRVLAEIRDKGREHPLFDQVVDEMMTSDRPIGSFISAREDDGAGGVRWSTTEVVPNSRNIKMTSRAFFPLKGTEHPGFRSWDRTEPRHYAQKILFIKNEHMSLQEAAAHVEWVKRDKDGNIVETKDGEDTDVGASGSSIDWYALGKRSSIDGKSTAFFFSQMPPRQVDAKLRDDPVVSLGVRFRFSTRGGDSGDRLITGHVRSDLMSVWRLGDCQRRNIKNSAAAGRETEIDATDPEVTEALKAIAENDLSHIPESEFEDDFVNLATGSSSSSSSSSSSIPASPASSSLSPYARQQKQRRLADEFEEDAASSPSAKRPRF